MISPSPAYVAHVAAEDERYVSDELFALLLSWGSSLPGRVLNPPTPQGLAGTWRPMSEWVALASSVGLPTLPYRYSSDDVEQHEGWYEPPPVPPDAEARTVVVVGRRVVGQPVPRELAARCCELAQRVATPLLGVDLARVDERWVFAGATVTPDLQRGGDPLLDALASYLGAQ